MPKPKRQRREYAPRLPAAARHEQLLDAALRVIERDGYVGVSIDAIAREANVTRPVVYGVFDGLGPLLSALIDRQEARALAQLMTALGGEVTRDDPRAFFLTAMRRLAETVTRDPTTWRPILVTGGGEPSEVRERIARDREVVRKRIEELVRGGLGKRAAREYDPEIASHALIALAEYFGRLIIETPDRFRPDRLVEAIDRLLGGLHGRPSRA